MHLYRYLSRNRFGAHLLICVRSMPKTTPTPTSDVCCFARNCSAHTYTHACTRPRVCIPYFSEYSSVIKDCNSKIMQRNFYFGSRFTSPKFVNDHSEYGYSILFVLVIFCISLIRLFIVCKVFKKRFYIISSFPVQSCMQDLLYTIKAEGINFGVQIYIYLLIVCILN